MKIKNAIQVTNYLPKSDLQFLLAERERINGKGGHAFIHCEEQADQYALWRLPRENERTARCYACGHSFDVILQANREIECPKCRSAGRPATHVAIRPRETVAVAMPTRR